MKNEEKIMLNYHLNGLMYTETLQIYANKTHDLDLKSYLYRIIGEINETVAQISNFLKKKLNKNDDDLSFKQKVTLQIDRLKTRMINSDFLLCLEVVKVINAMLLKAMKFIFSHQKMDKDYIALVDNQVTLCLSVESEISHYVNETYLNF